jgi:hypothetical protein
MRSPICFLRSASRSVFPAASLRATVRAVLLAAAAVGFNAARGQTPGPPRVFSFEATPIGALPPIALPMPASRDQNYWGLRLQFGQRQERGGPEDLAAIAGGIDYQIRGGSILGLTGGYQWREHCQATNGDCGGHTLWGARARFNLVTGGPTLAGLVGDESATSTLGTEFGFGYAPGVAPGVSACAMDFGVPFSIAMLERIRLVTFVTPGVVWDVGCSSGTTPTNRSYLMGFGFGIQQLGFRGLDVHFGAQRVFRGATGLQYGLTVSWVRLP